MVATQADLDTLNQLIDEERKQNAQLSAQLDGNGHSQGDRRLCLLGRRSRRPPAARGGEVMDEPWNTIWRLRTKIPRRLHVGEGRDVARAILDAVKRVADRYPEKVFPETGTSLDARSGSFVRRTCLNILREFEEGLDNLTQREEGTT